MKKNPLLTCVSVLIISLSMLLGALSVYADENADRGGKVTRPDGPCFSDGVTDPTGIGLGRYFDCGNGTVTDTVTGLIMLQNISCGFGGRNWVDANKTAAALGDGQCGLKDGSSPGDWRLMTKEEWKATVAQAVSNACALRGGNKSPTLTKRDGLGCFFEDANPVFAGVLATRYWSSTTVETNPEGAWGIDLDSGGVVDAAKPGGFRIWPVRDQ